jgi:hypothetical protein
MTVKFKEWDSRAVMELTRKLEADSCKEEM